MTESPAEFVGKMDLAPSPGPSTVTAIMFRAAPEVVAQVKAFVPPTANLYLGSVAPFGAYRPKFLLAEFGGGRFAVFSDFSGDGVIQETERLDFAPGDKRMQTAQFVVPGWHYASYPVTFAEPGEFANRSASLPPSKIIKMSNEVGLRGHVNVDGRNVPFFFSVDLKTGRPSAEAGRQFMDIDGNGDFDVDYRSPETVWARGAAAMFRVGRSYLSAKTIDPADGRVLFGSHPASDYMRFELNVGEVLPDFAFVDFEGAARKLSDYRGKVVLIDFWGTWCGPCVAQIPYLQRAYDQFHSQGLEIIGMNSEHPNATAADLTAGVIKARAFVAERRMSWPQAREASIKDLTARSFMVETWPTTVLVDREGRIVSVDRTDLGQPSLRGEALAVTLGVLLRKIPDQQIR